MRTRLSPLLLCFTFVLILAAPSSAAIGPGLPFFQPDGKSVQLFSAGLCATGDPPSCRNTGPEWSGQLVTVTLQPGVATYIAEPAPGLVASSVTATFGAGTTAKTVVTATRLTDSKWSIALPNPVPAGLATIEAVSDSWNNLDGMVVAGLVPEPDGHDQSSDNVPGPATNLSPDPGARIFVSKLRARQRTVRGTIASNRAGAQYAAYVALNGRRVSSRFFGNVGSKKAFKLTLYKGSWKAARNRGQLVVKTESAFGIGRLMTYLRV